MATPKQTDPQFKLRLPEKLKEQIDNASIENNRSINAEIVDRLEQSFSNWPRVKLPNDIMRRALAAHPMERDAFETRLQSVAANFAEQEFQSKENEFFRIDHAFEKILEIVDRKERDFAIEHFNAFMKAILKSVPEDIRKRVTDTVKYD